MTKKNVDIFCFAMRVVIIILFFVFFSAFGGKPSQQLHLTIQKELSADLTSKNAEAPAVNLIKVPPFQMDRLSVEERVHFSICDEIQKLFTDNKKITQLFIDLQKSQLFIKPKLIYKLYYPLLILISEDFPFLS